MSAVDEDDEPIDFDIKKIRVTVTTSTSKLKKSNPIVKLNRLTKEEILKHTKIQTYDSKRKTKPNDDETPYITRSKVQKEKLIESGESSSLVHKRKSDTAAANLTHSKKQKLSNSTGLPKSEIVSIPPKEQYNSEKSSSKRIDDTAVAVLPFRMKEIVWGKIKGWPHWPAEITGIEGKRYEVTWFNDYRKSKLFQSQISKFTRNFDEHAVKFSTSVGLETAAKEALICLAQRSKK